MPRVRVIKVPADKPEENSAPVQAEPTVAPEVKAPEPKAEEPKHSPAKKVVTSGDGIVITKKALVRIVIATVLLLLIVVAVANRETVDSPKTGDQKSGQTEAQKYEEELSKLVDLPQGKTPTFSTVDDAPKLASKSPTLFKNAQNGDVFLVYINDDKSGKVVLYRPSTKKIILFIDGVDLGQQSTTTTR